MFVMHLYSSDLSNVVSRKSKLKLYWSVNRPVVVYGCETWVLKESVIQKLSVFERKISWKIQRIRARGIQKNTCLYFST